MSALYIKLIFIAVALIMIIVNVMLVSKKEKKKEDIDVKSANIEVEQKGYEYWKMRFDGLKEDYDNREKYHEEGYEHLRMEYESREQFMRDMLEDARKDYQTLRNEFQELQDAHNKMSEKLVEANRLMADYEIKNMKLEAQLLNASKIDKSIHETTDKNI